MTRIASSLLALAVLCPAAFPATLVIEEIVAKVNGDVVLRSEFEDAMDEMRRQVAADTSVPAEQKAAAVEQRKDNVLRDLVDERLLIQKGQELGISVEAEVLRQRDALMKQYNLNTIEEFETWAAEKAGMPVEDLMARLRDNYLSQAVIGNEVGSRVVVGRDEIQKYYEEHKDEFVRKEGVRLAEILISKEDGPAAEVEKEANDVHARVKRGEPFAEMARRFSDSLGSKDAGGDIGIWRRGVLDPKIEQMVFDQNPGYITDLIETERGYLMLKVTDRYREGLAELEEVDEEIRNRIAGPRYAPAIREYLTDLRYDAYIEIRPGYADSGAAPGKDTSWTDPAKLAPVTTTRDEVLTQKKRKLLWMIPIGKKKSDAEKNGEDTASDIGAEN